MAFTSDMMIRMTHYLRNTEPKELLEKYTSKEFLLKDHNQTLEKELIFDSAFSITIVNEPNVLPNASRVNLLPENRVQILDLMRSIDKSISGKFFLCRTLTPPFKMAAVVVVVDDPEGEFAVRFSMYNLFPSTSRKNLLEMLPVGTIMAVKNPYFKVTGDGGYSLRTDSPGDVTFLNESQCQERFPTLTWKGEIPKMYKHLIHSSTPKTSEEWKTLGNNYFSKKNYSGALNAYTSGLKEDPKSVPLLSNRSAAYLQMEAYTSALSDANEVLKIQPSHVKATYRKIKSLCGLKEYKAALEFLDNIRMPHFQKPNRIELEKLKSNAKSYLHQQQTGDYDLPFMIKTARNNPGHSFDFADYTGPVEVRSSLGKGRGLFATENVNAGQLLIGAKAFALNVPENDTKSSYLNLKCNAARLNASVTDREEDALPALIARTLTMAPEKGKEFYKLYAGQELGYLRHEDGDDTSIVDIKRIKRICVLNSFEARKEIIIDKSYEGIWLMPSLINHSCYDCNCNWIVFGNFILIRAMKRIAKGEEILISYIKPVMLFPQRMDVFEKYMFLCNCRLCEVDQNETKKIHHKRERWFIDLKNMMELSGGLGDIATLKYYVNRITSLRPKNFQMNIYLVMPLTVLGYSHEDKQQYAKAAEAMEKSYEIFKDTDMVEMKIECLCNLVSFCLKNGDADKATKWIYQLKEALVLTFGTDCVSDAIEIVVNAKELMKVHGLSF